MRKIMLIILICMLPIMATATTFPGTFSHYTNWMDFSDSLIVHDYFRIYDSSGNLQFQFDNSTGEVSQRWEHFRWTYGLNRTAEIHYNKDFTDNSDFTLTYEHYENSGLNTYKVDSIMLDTLFFHAICRSVDSLRLDSCAITIKGRQKSGNFINIISVYNLNGLIVETSEFIGIPLEKRKQIIDFWLSSTDIYMHGYGTGTETSIYPVTIKGKLFRDL